MLSYLNLAFIHLCQIILFLMLLKQFLLELRHQALAHAFQLASKGSVVLAGADAGPNSSEQRRIYFVIWPDKFSELCAEYALDLFPLLGRQLFG